MKNDMVIFWGREGDPLALSRIKPKLMDSLLMVGKQALEMQNHLLNQIGRYPNSIEGLEVDTCNAQYFKKQIERYPTVMNGLFVVLKGTLAMYLHAFIKLDKQVT